MRYVFNLSNGQSLSILCVGSNTTYFHTFACGSEQAVSADKFCALLDYATRKGWFIDMTTEEV